LVHIYRDDDFLETLMLFVEETGKVKDLPTVLTGEIVSESLQFLEHFEFLVGVWENWFKQEAVLVLVAINRG
jgi:hypothetical protein